MRGWVLALLAAGAAHCEVRFNRDIRPIMAETCFRCHGPDKSSRMAGMRLDLPDEALRPTRSGAVPIVPGDPEKSAIVQRIFAAGARVMPPASAHKVLTESQKNTIRLWVAEGAKYEGHWAYQPVHRPSPPAGAPHPVDAFILDRLARESLKPSPEADRRTLIRRVSLDLTGIPPTPEETAAFLNDKSADAYEKLVDRLIASPRYAEQQAMRWLDAVRYADTSGFHGDNPLPAWPYRDYVLKSFRENKPFDAFTREQLAGDLIPGATVEQKVASAYNRLNRTSAEGGLQPKEYLAKYAADRVRTTVTVWLGSTLGCAECHDHKFDPFLARDFYAMKAFFADIKETGLVPDKGKDAWGTQVAIPTPDQSRRREELRLAAEAAREALKAKMTELEPRREEWEKRLLAQHAAGELAWKFQRPVSASAQNGAVLKIYNDEPVTSTKDGQAPKTEPGNGLVVASGPNPDRETYTVTIKPGAGAWTALAVELVQDESLPGIRLGRGADRVVISELEAEVRGRRVPFSAAMSNLNSPAPEHPAAALFDGDPKTGWGQVAYGDVSKPMLSLRFAEPLRTDADTVVTVRLKQDSEIRRATVGRFRLALASNDYAWPSPDPGKEIPDAVLRALRVEPLKRNTAQRLLVAGHFQWASADARPLALRLARAEQDLALLDLAIPRVVVTEATTPAETRVLPRGNWMDSSGEVVEPAIPAFLGKLETGSQRATRLDLADWLVSPDNPLTARVFVNRTWRHFFGAGLSRTLDDFGSQGEWPTHPELLDWLAAEFANGWNVNRLVRTIVTSQTYRQSSLPRPELAERDPDNRLLARQSRYRVDAEVVRDIALSVSGLLVERFGGPSAKPYQPDGYLATLNFPKREYAASLGDDLYRRGVYTFWQRSFLHPSLLTFDAPTREECTIHRTTSNTPLQALVLLNDPIYVETARVFAARVLRQKGDRIAWAVERALDRPPTKDEKAILDDLYRKSLAEFRRAPADAAALIRTGEAPVAADLPAAEVAAMTTVTRAILNLHETITRN
jgi:hypothetical protein